MSSIFDVTGLNKYVAAHLSENPLLSAVSVRGEISGFKKYPSGHLYFSLKDKESQVSCVAFRGNAEQFGFVPENGMSVVVMGRASLYERDGRFQLVIYQMQIDGVGDLFAEFEKLKRSLEEEGIFDASHKKKIPFLPRRIGVVTSEKGAVISDIIQILSRRYPNFNLLLYPSAVQGKTAALELTKGIRYFHEKKNVDVIIIGRGGGSMEDLWCFNDRALAYAIYESDIPVISAVGHETDFTICDFVSDMRAPTPSAAAELVMPVKEGLYDSIEEMKARLQRSFSYGLSKKKHSASLLFSELRKNSPVKKLEYQSQELDMLSLRLQHGMQRNYQALQTELEKKILRLDSESPLKKLSKGYGLVSDVKTKKVIFQISSVKENQSVAVDLADGRFLSTVYKVERKG